MAPADTRTLPPFAYYGGKTRIADRIVALLPRHEHYVEPFAGSLAVLLAKPRSAHETVNDLDGDLVTFWRVLRNRPDDLARVCALTPHGRAEHQAAYQDGDAELGDLERARRVWVLLSQGRAGTLRRTGWRYYRDPAGTHSAMPDYLTAYVDRIPACARRLHGVSLECRDALDVINDYGREPAALIYADPPYLASTRQPGRYRVEMADDDAHRALADALHACRAAVVVSGYPSPLYDQIYAGWHRLAIPATTGQGGQRGARTEVLWSNRPLTEQATLWASEATAS
jgi:DNA adenine methylase